MISLSRLVAMVLPLLLVCSGCNETVTAYTTTVQPTSSIVLDPKAPDEKAAEAARSSAHVVAAGKEEAAAVKLEKLNWKALRARIEANPTKAKYIIIDAWATDCGPCRENFPHLVEMHRKYAAKGLAVMSVSLDDPSEPRLAKAAEEFLKEKKAVFTNILLDEEAGVGYEKFGVNAIPSVFLYGPDGKELKRFTLDDPDNQFTYDEVEKTIAGLLDGKPATGDAGTASKKKEK